MALIKSTWLNWLFLFVIIRPSSKAEKARASRLVRSRCYRSLRY